MSIFCLCLTKKIILFLLWLQSIPVIYCIEVLRIRKQSNYQKLSGFETGHIVGPHEAKVKFHGIAKRIQRNFVTASHCWRSWSEEERQHRRWSAGRTETTTEWEDKRLEFINTSDLSFSVEVCHRIAKRAVYHRIRPFELIFYRPRWILPLHHSASCPCTRMVSSTRKLEWRIE